MSVGCGKKDDSKGKGGGGGGGGDKADPPPAADVTIDCDAFAAKMTECIDTFAPAYAKTEFGGKSGKTAVGGPVDEGVAAKNFKLLWSMTGDQLCKGGDSMIDTPLQQKDPPWKKRVVDCASKQSCDEWAPCMATAMGEPLSR